MSGILSLFTKRKNFKDNDDDDDDDEKVPNEMQKIIDDNYQLKSHTLNLSKTRITNSQFQKAISNCFKKFHQYEHKDFHHVYRMEAVLNSWKTIPNCIFIHFKGLKEIILDQNRLSNWPEEINNIASLQHISISMNMINGAVTFFEKNNNNKSNIVSLSSLKYLDISENRIISIDINSLKSLVKLKSLKLGGNVGIFEMHKDAQTIDNVFRSFCEIEELNLNLCSLHSFYVRFPEHSHLKSLRLSRNNFRTGFQVQIPILMSTTVCQAQEPQLSYYPITELDLSHCNIPSIPDHLFTSMPKIKFLNLSFNCITTIPPNISVLTDLSQLVLNDNSIQTLSNLSLTSLTNLSILKLNGNMFKSAQDISPISKVTSLTRLKLKRNHLTEISPDFARNLTNLQKLNLSCNYLSGPLLLELDTLTKLRTLKIQNNAITELITTRIQESNSSSDQQKSLGNLTSLETLYLSHNKLSHIPYQFVSLKKLVLNHCSITSIDEQKLADMTNLKQLLLDQNKLTEKEILKCKVLSGTLDALSITNTEISNDPKDLKAWCMSNGVTLRASVDDPPSEILPKHLYLSSARPARNKHALKKRGITHILTIASFEPAFPTEFIYKVIHEEDRITTDLLSKFDEAHEFIEKAIEQGGAALVHCAAGVSRSATIVISFIMRYTQYKSLNDAMKFVKSKRSVICPNPGFMKQLEQYEHIIKEQSFPHPEMPNN